MNDLRRVGVKDEADAVSRAISDVAAEKRKPLYREIVSFAAGEAIESSCMLDGHVRELSFP